VQITVPSCKEIGYDPHHPVTRFIYTSHFSFHEGNFYLLLSGCRINRLTELRAHMCLHSIYFFEALSLVPELSLMSIQTLIMEVPSFSHSHRYVVNKKTVKQIMIINNNLFIYSRADSTA
jgi:hypothetical protein